MNVAIFGGTGFVGSYVIDAVLSAGMHPVVLVRPGSEHKVRHAESCAQVPGDVFDTRAVAEVLQQADAAFYNIGILREFPEQGVTFERMHFDGAKQVMDTAAKHGVKRFLLMSANGVKADGTDYQKTKYLAEQYLATTALDWTVFRPSVIFGPPRGRDEFATRLRRDIVDSPLPAPLFYQGLLPNCAGKFQMSPVHVADVAQAIVDALNTKETIGQVLALGGPTSVTWRDTIKIIADTVGKKKPMLPVPAFAVSTAAALLERFPAFPVTRSQIQMLLEGNTCPPDDLKTLGIMPRSFDRAALGYLGQQTGEAG